MPIGVKTAEVPSAIVVSQKPKGLANLRQDEAKLVIAVGQGGKVDPKARDKTRKAVLDKQAELTGTATLDQ